jgi:hypothetical protein
LERAGLSLERAGLSLERAGLSLEKEEVRDLGRTEGQSSVGECPLFNS